MFSRQVLNIDTAAVAAKIEAAIKAQVMGTLKRRGVVVGLSGGIDSSVCVALAARALGKERVLAIFMPERDSSGDSIILGKLVAETVGVASVLEDIAPILHGARCYERQEEAIRLVFPEYGEGYKITLPSILEHERLNVSRLTIEAPGGEQKTARMSLQSYLGLVAATNFKQRVRKMIEYYHADRLNYAVVGTPNRLEYDQGFFVKNGDGAADIKPIAHLYKTQVYALAEYLGIPEEVRRRPPTTDTFSMPQGQDEFYFALPYDRMDLCLWAHNNGALPADVGPTLGLSTEQVERVFKDIESKRRATRYLHLPPLLVEAVPELKRDPEPAGGSPGAGEG